MITLTTDFGVSSPYVAAMKGVILAINPRATLVDITHAVPPQDIREAAVVLDEVADRFPAGTIHVAVVDPGVGTDRAILYARIGCQQFVAPDNGLLGPLMQRRPPTAIYHVTERRYWLEPVSATFHGRDIMAPVAAHLSLGLDPALLGPPATHPQSIEWPAPLVSSHRIDGVVLRVDSFGNLITNITGDLLVGRPTDNRACVVCNIFETFGIFQTYADQPAGTLIALVGSSGRLELAVVGANAADLLGIRAGERVTIGWGVWE